SIETTRERQSAIQELARRVELREDLAIEAGRTWGAPRRLEQFVSWAETETSPVTPRPWPLRAAPILPLLTVALGAAHWPGAIDRPLWLLPLLAGMAISAMFAKRSVTALRRALPESEVLARYAELLRIVAESEFQAPMLRALHREVA